MVNQRTSYIGLIGFLAFMANPQLSSATDLHGRVIDRGSLRADGYAKGVSGVQVTLYDGKKSIGTATTNSKGVYRIRKVTVARFRAVYLARGWYPSQVSRSYALGSADTASRDVYVDAAPVEKGEGGQGAKGEKGSKGAKSAKSAAGKAGYHQGLARGFLALTRQESFFRENPDDSTVDPSDFFDGRDSSADYQGAMCELLWAEFLSQDRPLETRYYLAAALFPLLDSLGWGKLQGMKRYLEVDPDAVREVANGMRESLRAPKKLPTPKDVRKAKVPLELASHIASGLMIEADLTERAKDKFLAQWKKSWGKESPSFREDGDETVFRPNAVMAKLAVSKAESPVVHYLRGRGLFAARDFAGAADELGYANRLRGSYPAARHLEAMAYIKLGREQEALGRFHALREAPDPYWKAKAYYGLGLLAEKENRHSEAASNFWKAIRLYPESESIYLLAEVSLKLTERGELEKLLQQRAAKGDHRAHYWLGRFGEEDHQTGLAEDHYRRAWDGSPAPEYAEARSRLYLSREEYGPALALLEPIRPHLSPAGRLELAECFLQAGRSMEASKEYQAAYAAGPTPEILSRYVEAMVQSNRAQEAIGIVNAFGDQNNPRIRFALAKAYVGNHQPDKARPILEDLVKREENNADFHFLLGRCYYEERNYSKAKREFDDALKYRQDHLEAIYYTGLSGIRMGRADAARNYFNELAQRTSADWKARGLMGVGLTFAAQNKPEAAENFYQRSLLVLETAEAEALLALSKRRLGAPEKWVPLAKKAYDRDNRQPKAVLAMGEALIAQGKKREAIKHFQNAVLNDPNSCELLAGLAKSQVLTGAFQAGLSTSASAITLCPQEPEPYYYAAVSSDKLHNRKEAEDFFKSFRKAGGDAGLLPENYR